MKVTRMALKSKYRLYKTIVAGWVKAHSHRLFWITLIVIMIFGMIHASASLKFSLNIDEPFTANLVHLSLPEIAESFDKGEDINVTYYILLKGWVTVFGESEIALRSLSVLLFGLTILAVGVSARWVIGEFGGLLAAFLVSTSSLGLYHAGIARSYALLGFVASLAGLLCIYPMQSLLSLNHRNQVLSTGSYAFVYLIVTIVNVIGLFTHPIYIFFLVACSVTSFLVSRRTFLLLGICATVSVGIYLVLGFNILRASFSLPATNWMARPSLNELGNGFLNLWGKQKTIALGIYLALTLLWQPIIGIKSLFSKLGLFSSGLVLSASIVPFAVSQFRPVFLAPRTPILFLPMACIFVAFLMSRRLTWLTVIIVAVFAFGSARSAVQTFLSTDPYPVRQSVQYVLTKAKCDDTFVLGSLSYSEVEYYLRRFNVPLDCIHRESYPLDTASHAGWIAVPALLSHKSQMEKEAMATVARLSAQPASRVWLFYNNPNHDSGQSYGHEVTQIMKSQLDCQMTLAQVVELRGSWFDSIIIYTADDRVTRSLPCN